MATVTTDLHCCERAVEDLEPLLELVRADTVLGTEVSHGEPPDLRLVLGVVHLVKELDLGSYCGVELRHVSLDGQGRVGVQLGSHSRLWGVRLECGRE